MADKLAKTILILISGTMGPAMTSNEISAGGLAGCYLSPTVLSNH